MNEDQLQEKNNYLSELLNVIVEGRLYKQSLDVALETIKNLKDEINYLNDDLLRVKVERDKLKIKLSKIKKSIKNKTKGGRAK